EAHALHPRLLENGTPIQLEVLRRQKEDQAMLTNSMRQALAVIPRSGSTQGSGKGRLGIQAAVARPFHSLPGFCIFAESKQYDRQIVFRLWKICSKPQSCTKAGLGRREIACLELRDC